MYSFGVGALFAKFKDGSVMEFGTLQDVSLDFSWDKKELYGRNQFPVYVARGKGKIDGKATYANIAAKNLSAIMNGTITTGQKIIAEPVDGTVPSATPFTLSITAPSSGTVGSLLAVYDVSGDTKVPLELVTTTPTTGQYSYDSTTHTLTFAEADAKKAIQYQYDYTTTTGKTVTLNNSLMGNAPTFSVELYTMLDDKHIVIELNKCTTDKLTLNAKNEDFMIPNFSFSAFADAADKVGNIYLDE